VDLTYAPDVTTERWPAETWERVLKATWERSAAALALVLLSPLLLVLVVAIRLDSAGPALFRQVRVGRGGRTFRLYKLRTMSTDASARLALLRPDNEADGPLFKLRADPRITRVGATLRRYSLDELPQLWNVVRGEMALVGPRPALPDEVATYDEIAVRRLAVKPGLTGLWQVSGRSDLPWHVAIRLDVHYVEHWSLGLDLSILTRTPRAVLGHRGAY
jgi:lipopolysaccharide/colanic/teichoic acid biosynthesis glycosyltransferase